MESGKLRQYVTVQRPNETEDAAGQTTLNYEDYIKTWADIRPFTGREHFQADKHKADITHKITMRYVSGITADCRILYDGQVFELTAPPINSGMLDYQLELVAKVQNGIS